MGQKELLRGKVLEMVKQGNKTLKTAVELKINAHGERLSRAYHEGRNATLIQSLAGKPPDLKTAEPGVPEPERAAAAVRGTDSV